MSTSSVWQDYVSARVLLGSLEADASRRRSEIEQRYFAAISRAASDTTVVAESAAVSQVLKGAESALADVFSMFDKPPEPELGVQTTGETDAAAIQREALDVEAWSAQALTRGRSLARTLSRIRAEEKRVAESTVAATPAPVPEPDSKPDSKRRLILSGIMVIILIGIVMTFMMMLF